jgi:hypothetical protein
MKHFGLGGRFGQVFGVDPAGVLTDGLPHARKARLIKVRDTGSGNSRTRRNHLGRCRQSFRANANPERQQK